MAGRGAGDPLRPPADAGSARRTRLHAADNARAPPRSCRTWSRAPARCTSSPPGRVDEIAASLRPEITGELLVALGGGRVIDTAKALASADPPRRVAAIPTTLSGAEMTAVHRRADGCPDGLAASPSRDRDQRPGGLRLAAAGGARVQRRQRARPCGRGAADPAAQPGRDARGARGDPRCSISALPADGSEPDRPALALGALLAGYVIGSTGYGLHHVMSQTLVRFAGAGHGQANAILLPHTIDALARRFPDEIARSDARSRWRPGSPS